MYEKSFITNPSNNEVVAMSKALALALVLVFLTASSIFAVIPVSGASIAENTWSAKAPMHDAKSAFGVAVVNNKIFAIGGSTQNGSTAHSNYDVVGGIVATNEQYNPVSNEWIFKSPMPTPRYLFAIAAYGNKIYCIGGNSNGSITGLNEVYDTTTDTWETKSPMPTARDDLRANVVDGKIYLIGGYPNRVINEVYDPVKDSWTTKTPLPTVVVNYASTVMDSKIFIISSNLNQVYDAKTDSWSRAKPPSSFMAGSVASATTGEFAPKRLYVFNSVSGSNLVYNPATDSWDVFPVIPTERSGFDVAVVNDRFYAIGGYTSFYPSNDPFSLYTNRFASNEEYVPVGYGTPDPSYVPPAEITPPKISITSPLNLTYNESSVPLVFNADKAVNWTSYSLDGQQNVTFSGIANLTGLSNGLHNITVFAQDTFGNIGSSETISFTITKPESELFPVAPVATVSIVAVALVVAGLLVYHKKHKHKSVKKP